MKTEEKLYFAYGSNMNLNQMEFRCPDAEAVDTVRLEGYRLTFRMNGGRRGVAAVLPEEGSHADGVLWGKYHAGACHFRTGHQPEQNRHAKN